MLTSATQGDQCGKARGVTDSDPKTEILSPRLAEFCLPSMRSNGAIGQTNPGYRPGSLMADSGREVEARRVDAMLKVE